MNLRRLSVVLMAAALLSAAPALAKMSRQDGMIALSVPGENWALRLPESDWALAQERPKPDGTGMYYYLTSDSRSLNFSVFLDKTSVCNSGASCRELFWTNPQYKNALDVKHLERNGFAASTFHFDHVMNMPASQTNVSAHAYRNGFWIDIHLSKVGGTTPPAEPLLKFLDTLKIE